MKIGEGFQTLEPEQQAALRKHACSSTSQALDQRDLNTERSHGKSINKVIITCAVTGAIHTPTLSAALPYTPADIARQAIEAARAGAAILHLHARNPKDGSPTGDPEVFAQFLPQIHASCDAVINLTTGGSPDMSVEQRLAAALRFKPEMCSLNMGSMNFAFHGDGREGRRVEVSVGEEVHRGQRGVHLPQHLPRRCARVSADGRFRHAL